MGTYYDLLNLGTDADKAEIKRAFHALAKRLHPDVCRPAARAGACSRAPAPAEGGAIDRARARDGGFLEVLAAYETLIDDRKREEYDSTLERHDGTGGKAHGKAGATAAGAGLWRGGTRSIPKSRVSFALSLRELASLRVPSRTGGRRRRTFANPKGYHVCVGLTGEELARGARVEIDVPARVVCPVCGGDRVHCAFCSSKGQVLKAVPVPVPIPRHLGHGDVFSLPLRTLKRGGYAFFMIDALVVKIRILEDADG
jgi:DnaJ-class molecular chaperone